MPRVVATEKLPENARRVSRSYHAPEIHQVVAPKKPPENPMSLYATMIIPRYYGVEHGRDYVPDLDPYDRQVSWNLNTGLRHHVGKTGSHPGFGLKCDEAGWMRIIAVLRYSNFWDHSSYRPLEQLCWGNRDGREEIDREVAQFRLQTLFKIMHHSVVHGRRVRIQVLAFGVMPDVPREDEYIERCNVTPDVVIPDDS